MTVDKETATHVESLYRELLEEAFQGTLTFDPITLELTQNIFRQDAFHVTVVYQGDGGLPDPAKLNRISSLMIDGAAELDIENTIIESYVDSREYAGHLGRVEEPPQQVSGRARWQELLNVARYALAREDFPIEPILNMAVDRCYFAMYHALCHSNGQSLAGKFRARRRDDWSRVYLGMNESTITERLRHHRPQASEEVKDFGAAFAILQEHRDRAMERVDSTFLPSEVIRLIQRSESAIASLLRASAEERRSLALNLLVGNLHGKGPNVITAPDAGMASTV